MREGGGGVREKERGRSEGGKRQQRRKERTEERKDKYIREATHMRGFQPYGELTTFIPSTDISLGMLGPQISKSTIPT